MRDYLLKSVMLAAALVLVVTGNMRPAAALTVPSGQQLKGSVDAGDSLVQKVHGWHCRRRYGWVRHCHDGYCHAHRRWHRHRRACVRYYPRSYYYGPGYYYGPRIYIGPRYYRKRRFRRRFNRRRFKRNRFERRQFRRRGGLRRRGAFRQRRAFRRGSFRRRGGRGRGFGRRFR